MVIIRKVCRQSLQKFASLKSYFLSKDWADERFKGPKGWFQNPLLEPALLFQSNAISMFTNFKKILQRNGPSIHLLKPAMEILGHQMGSSILHAHVLCSHNNSVYEIDLDDNNV